WASKCYLFIYLCIPLFIYLLLRKAEPPNVIYLFIYLFIYCYGWLSLLLFNYFWFFILYYFIYLFILWLALPPNFINIIV
ncbi:MAG: hypothetical protein N7Q72_00650, partial [Spiroplasma sp. Tabriz.8]|nr:hypothetical protein [Spiroplasma sp. Tabriz.8]